MIIIERGRERERKEKGWRAAREEAGEGSGEGWRGGKREATRWGRRLECKSWVTFARQPRRHIGSKL
ncbi:MAG: hypothetical protein ACKESB_02390 [Candidatus Hodgkinia cicadicola]